MLVSELITDVRFELQEPVPGFWTDPELLNQINRAQQDFVNRTRILESDATMDTEVGRSEYVLPADCLSTKAVFYNQDTPAVTPNVKGWRRLEASDLEHVAQRNQNFLSDNTSELDDPIYYYTWGRSLQLVPTPKEDGHQVKIYYKAKPADLLTVSDSLEIDDSLAPALRAYVLWKAWTKEKEMDLARQEEARYFQGVRDGLRWVKLQSGDRVNSIATKAVRGYGYGIQNGYK
jgi:hypothetical protein